MALLTVLWEYSVGISHSFCVQRFHFNTMWTLGARDLPMRTTNFPRRKILRWKQVFKTILYATWADTAKPFKNTVFKAGVFVLLFSDNFHYKFKFSGTQRFSGMNATILGCVYILLKRGSWNRCDNSHLDPSFLPSNATVASQELIMFLMKAAKGRHRNRHTIL